MNNNSINFIDPYGLRGFSSNPLPPGMHNNPFHVPGDNGGPAARRAPGGSSSGCHNIIVKVCDEWCCDYDECTKTCKVKCPMYKPSSSKAVKKCIKFHFEPRVRCPGKTF